MEVAKGKRLHSQMVKKQMKNSARLPRTAGLRTLSELTDSLTQAGLDPSRIQERAEMIAKTRAAQRKRKRDDEDAEMEVDDESGEEDETMDVDEEATPNKRRRSNLGTATAVTAKREPRGNRQLAGLRDDTVCILSFTVLFYCFKTDLI